MYKRYVQNTTYIRIIKDRLRTKVYRKKLMADLKSATKTCIESVEKTHATENEKKFVGQCQFSKFKFRFTYVVCVSIHFEK